MSARTAVVMLDGLTGLNRIDAEPVCRHLKALHFNESDQSVGALTTEMNWHASCSASCRPRFGLHVAHCKALHTYKILRITCPHGPQR